MRRSTAAATPRSRTASIPAWLFLLLAGARQQLAHALDLDLRQLAVGDQVREQQLGGALEQLAGQVLQRALARGFLLDGREVAVNASFLFVPYVALLLQRSQDGQ